MSGEGIPSMLHWGLTGKVDKFWMPNDLKILGACYRCEVENFLTYLSNHHEFFTAKKEVKYKMRATSSVMSTESIGEHSATGTTTPRVTTPIFALGEADSMSRFQQPIMSKLYLLYTRKSTLLSFQLTHAE